MKWIVTEIDGKVASIAADYRHLAAIAGHLAAHSPDAVERVTTRKITSGELFALEASLGWDDLCLFGSKFQKSVWKGLFDLTHPACPSEQSACPSERPSCHSERSEGIPAPAACPSERHSCHSERSEGISPTLLSYTDFAARIGNPQGVRAVAHAVALNPVAYVIPCHLIVPKESMDRVREIRRSAEATLFRGSDLYLLDSIDVGEYAWGADLKRELIKQQLLNPNAVPGVSGGMDSMKG